MTPLRTHLLSMLSAGIAYEIKQAQAANSEAETVFRSKRASVLRAALYRISTQAPSV